MTRESFSGSTPAAANSRTRPSWAAATPVSTRVGRAPLRNVDAKGRATVANVSFSRRLDTGTALPANPPLAATDLPLDAAVDTLSPGVQVVVEGRYSNAASNIGIRRWLVRSVAAVEKRGAGWSTLTGPSTVLTLDRNLAAKHGALTLNYADLRTVNVHLVTGTGFRLRADPQNTPAARGMELDFFGTAEEIEPL